MRNWDNFELGLLIIILFYIVSDLLVNYDKMKEYMHSQESDAEGKDFL